jgi:hypothetical protein
MSSSSPFDHSIDVTTWLKKDRIEKTLGGSATSEVSSTNTLTELLFGKAAPLMQGQSETEDQARFLPYENFLHSLVLEQLKKPEDLLKLNPSRRESLARFLSELSRMPEAADPMERLKQFTRMDRTETEHAALKQLFKQIALVQIGKALLLKSWSFHSRKNSNKADLKDLTSAIERGLRPFIHLQTSTCQLIQQNFYSWYKMTSSAQDDLWQTLESTEDLEGAKCWLLRRASALSAETLGERQRYSCSFYQNLWRAIDKHKLFQPRAESVLGFSPTLRNGVLMEQSPSSIQWIGFEPLSFELLFGEIRYFWTEPKETPLWLKGSGLEMSMEQQGSLLTHSGKQNVLKQMDSVTSCEIAVIAEETLIRGQGRSLAAQALRKQVDQHEILKKLKQPATTRGIYQTCQALEKLRHGGLLIWAREELLTESSGKPALQYILNQAKILLIADLSLVTSEREEITRNLPKALYLLKKENGLEDRKSHRPIMIKAYGSIGSDAEASLLFDRIMALVQKPTEAFPLEPFQLHARVSPMDQREWEQHWFNPADDELVDQIEDLKRNSTPLGQLAQVRTLHPSMHVPSKNFPANDMFPESHFGAQKGFFAWVESHKNGNEIFTATSDRLPEYMKSSHSLIFIAPMEVEWIGPLQILVRSSLTRDWFNYSVESKKGAWLVKDGDFKSIPIPKHLADVLLTQPGKITEFSPGETRILNMIGSEPGLAVKAIENHPHLKPRAFVLASQVLTELESHQGALFSLVSPDEEVIYSKFFQSVLTAQDLCGIHQHPLIRFTPTLTAHQTVQNFTLLKFPTPGILITTAKGITQTLFIQDSWLRERCYEQLKELQSDVSEPSWGEIVKHVKLPKNPDQAQATAVQILRAHASEKLRRRELNHLISVCLAVRKQNAEKMGLLQ